ncbi:hypothetical protein [Terrihabitans sp. B22-R8]|uniref:hypothetical protein n=1 Tax=Terrihabitans sp. B22-R8 TaxID=3425128 RepID=UPI00403C0944
MPALILRNAVSHFRARATEWIAAAGLTAWGVSLLRNEFAFASSPNFDNLAAMASEWQWGLICAAVGAVRLIALLVNGTYDGFQYSPHLRAATAFIACFVWCSIWIGFLPSPTATVAYFMILAFEINNVSRAAADIGAAKVEHGRTRS